MLECKVLLRIWGLRAVGDVDVDVFRGGDQVASVDRRIPGSMFSFLHPDEPDVSCHFY